MSGVVERYMFLMCVDSSYAQLILLRSRKGHFAHHLDGAHLKGIGGPGAPHVFRLERVSDAGAQPALSLFIF